MGKWIWIVVIVIVVVIIGMFIFRGDDSSNSNVGGDEISGGDLDNIPADDFSNLESSDNVFNEIDNSVEEF